MGNSPEECEEAATALNRLMPSLTEDYTALKAADVARMLSTGLTRIYLDATSRGRCKLAPPSFFAARQRDAKHGLKMWP